MVLFCSIALLIIVDRVCTSQDSCEMWKQYLLRQQSTVWQSQLCFVNSSSTRLRRTLTCLMCLRSPTLHCFIHSIWNRDVQVCMHRERSLALLISFYSRKCKTSKCGVSSWLSQFLPFQGHWAELYKQITSPLMKKAYVHHHFNFQDAQVFPMSGGNKVQAGKTKHYTFDKTMI